MAKMAKKVNYRDPTHIVDNVQIKDAVTGSIYLLTVSDGEIKLKESDR